MIWDIIGSIILCMFIISAILVHIFVLFDLKKLYTRCFYLMSAVAIILIFYMLSILPLVGKL